MIHYFIANHYKNSYKSKLNYDAHNLYLDSIDFWPIIILTLKTFTLVHPLPSDKLVLIAKFKIFLQNLKKQLT